MVCAAPNAALAAAESVFCLFCAVYLELKTRDAPEDCASAPPVLVRGNRSDNASIIKHVPTQTQGAVLERRHGRFAPCTTSPRSSYHRIKRGTRERANFWNTLLFSSTPSSQAPSSLQPLDTATPSIHVAFQPSAHRKNGRAQRKTGGK
jgi:hypothetical protein